MADRLATALVLLGLALTIAAPVAVMAIGAVMVLARIYR